MAELRRKILTGNEGESTGTVASQDYIDNLNQVTTQAKILEPEPAKIRVGGKEVSVYPFSARLARKFTGLAFQVLGAARGDGDATLRVTGVLVEKYIEPFTEYLANALAPAGKSEPAEILIKQRELDEQLTPLEIATAFVTLCSLNKSLELFKGQDAKNA